MSRSGKGALKHGLYARRLTEDEIELIGPVPILNIDGEIAYQRAVINRLGQILENNGLAAESNEALTVETRNTVKLLNEALGRLLTYLRLHHLLKGDLTEFREEIEAGKMIGRRRRHVFDYFKPPSEGEAEAARRGASAPTGGSHRKPSSRNDEGSSQDGQVKRSNRGKQPPVLPQAS